MDDIKEIIITSNSGVVDLTSNLRLLRDAIGYSIECGFTEDLEEEDASEIVGVLNILEEEV